MKVVACAVPESAKSVLTAPDFADAFSTELPGTLSAIEVARNAMSTAPSWVHGLMQLRSKLMAPFGLITEPRLRVKEDHFVGFFPIISITQSRAVLGLDDKHLDFRLVVDTAPTTTGGTHAILSTVIKRHNVWGKIYLAAVLPFHKLIVPSMLKRASG